MRPGDRETGRPGDRETGRHPTVSPCLRVSVSPCLRVSVSLGEQQLHEDDVEPAPELVADLAEAGYLYEAEGGV